MGKDRAKYDNPVFRATRRTWGQRIRNGAEPPCSRCGQPILAGDTWHLDHYDDTNPDALAPAHADCNTRAGGRKAQAMKRRPSRPRSQNW